MTMDSRLEQQQQQQQQQQAPPPPQMQQHQSPANGRGPVPMEAPPLAIYSSLDELIAQANAHATARGYRLVVVRSKTNAQGQKTWVHLACDRHGTKRNTHNLTPETRKKNRRSRRCECPMYCVAQKVQNDLWELKVRHAEHNHGPYEPPPKKKKDVPQQPASELVNLDILQTPSNCTADFCLIPIGTSKPSVSEQIADVQRVLKRSGLSFTMHASGTSIEGPWDQVTRVIGQCHSLLHGQQILRVQTDIRIGSRTDKKQNLNDKVDAVRRLLENETAENALDDDSDGGMDNTEHTLQENSHSMSAYAINPAIAPDLERMPPPGMTHQMPPHLHAMMSHPIPHQMTPQAHNNYNNP